MKAALRCSSLIICSSSSLALTTGNAEGDDLDAAQIAPLAGQLLVERVGQLQRVAGQRGVADAHFADLRERGLKRGQQLSLQLAVDSSRSYSPR